MPGCFVPNLDIMRRVRRKFNLNTWKIKLAEVEKLVDKNLDIIQYAAWLEVHHWDCPEQEVVVVCATNTPPWKELIASLFGEADDDIDASDQDEFVIAMSWADLQTHQLKQGLRISPTPKQPELGEVLILVLCEFGQFWAKTQSVAPPSFLH